MSAAPLNRLRPVPRAASPRDGWLVVPRNRVVERRAFCTRRHLPAAPDRRIRRGRDANGDVTVVAWLECRSRCRRPDRGASAYRLLAEPRGDGTA